MAVDDIGFNHCIAAVITLLSVTLFPYILFVLHFIYTYLVHMYVRAIIRLSLLIHFLFFSFPFLSFLLIVDLHFVLSFTLRFDTNKLRFLSIFRVLVSIFE